MHGEQTSAAPKDKEVNVKDLRSPAISVARTIRYRSSHRQAGRSYAAIVLARVVRNSEPEFRPGIRPLTTNRVSSRRGEVLTRLTVKNALNRADHELNELRNDTTRDARRGLCVDFEPAGPVERAECAGRTRLQGSREPRHASVARE
jgi:hypothetical protein